MNKIIEKLIQLQQSIYDFHNQDEEFSFDWQTSPRFSFFIADNKLCINYYGAGYDESPKTKSRDLEEGSNYGFCALLDFLSEQENADRMAILTFDGPDEGANGCNEWNFERLINAGVTFPNLLEFEIKLTDLGDHNESTINYYEENGTIAALVSKMPALRKLVVPEAPDADFFTTEHKELRVLRVQAGGGTEPHKFLTDLATSNSFPKLYSMDFTDYNNQFGDMDKKDFVSVEILKRVFNSPTFQHPHFHFTLRNSILTEEELFEVQHSNPKIQFLYINSQGGKYVSHMMKK